MNALSRFGGRVRWMGMAYPTSRLGPLTVRRVRRPSDNTAEKPLTVVLLHGFGAGGDDLVGLADDLVLPPGTDLIFPEALHSLEELMRQPAYGARAWWLIDFAAIERAMARGEERDQSKTVPEGLAAARAALSGMLDALAAESEGDGGERRLVLGGFSQGAMLALDLALREPSRRLAGLVQLSGTFLAAHEWTPLMPGRRGLRVFQSHGRTDVILPYGAAERLRSALADAGLDVTFEQFREGHTIPRGVLDRLGAWLSAL